MAKILGIGGLFIRSASPAHLRDWYQRVLGFELESWGGKLFPPLPSGKAVWSVFDEKSDYFEPSTHTVMVNFVVEDLDGILAHAAEQGVLPLKRDDSDPHGRFAWLLDPNGMKIELWEPKPTA